MRRLYFCRAAWLFVDLCSCDKMVGGRGVQSAVSSFPRVRVHFGRGFGVGGFGKINGKFLFGVVWDFEGFSKMELAFWSFLF